MQLYRHAVSSRIGLGKLSTLPSVSDLGREEGGDCGGGKKSIIISHARLNDLTTLLFSCCSAGLGAFFCPFMLGCCTFLYTDQEEEKGSFIVYDTPIKLLPKTITGC